MRGESDSILVNYDWANASILEESQGVRKSCVFQVKCVLPNTGYGFREDVSE